VEDQTELICRYLPEGTLTYVNEAYCRYFNKSRGELINHSFMPLIPAEDHAHVAANIAKLSPQNPVVTYEHRVILPDGSLRWQMWTDRALYDDAGLAVEFQAVGSDITDRKMAETELRRLSAELEARVVQRTTELTLVNDSLISEVTERRRAEAELRVQQRSLTLLNDITRAALLEVSLADMAEALADRLAQMVGADACTLTLLDANGRSNRLAAASNGREFNPGSLLPEKDEQDLALMVLATGAPLVVEDVAASPEIRNHIPERLPGSKPIRSLYVLPLISSGLKLGAALLVYFQPHALTPEETALGEQAAGQVALALAKAQLYEAEQQRVGQLEALYSATSAVVSTLEEKALQEQILIAARRALPAAEKGALFLVDAESGEMQLCTLVGYADEHVHTSPFITRGYTAQAVRLRQALLVADTRSDESTRYEGEIEEMRLIRSTIVAPFVLGAQVLGAISMDSTRVEAFDHSDLQLLEAFAAAATAAIHNAQLHARLQELATIDDMTGLFNRRFFFELGEREVERALRFNHPLTAIMLDIDHFKHVNDTFGHPVGDRVLEELAQRCQRELREVDLVGRYGGEEFTILLPETRWQQGCQVAERLRRAIEAAPLTDEPEPISITVSMGVAPCTERTPNLSAVLANADRALYQAKRTGRNRVCSFLEEAEEGHPS
jgi:diguanylate cyclase (GGDEF)-like protein/PAS domain S-box-containing protein